jgi:hypothetical protein
MLARILLHLSQRLFYNRCLEASALNWRRSFS